MDNAGKSIENYIEDYFSSIDFSEIEKIAEGTFGYGGYGGSFAENVKALLSGDRTFGESFFEGLLRVAFSEVFAIVPLFVTLFGVILLLSLLSNFKDGLLSESVRSAVNLCFVLAVSVILLTKIISLTGTVKTTLVEMKNQMFAVFPVLMSLLVAAGANSLVPTVQPLLYFFSVTVVEAVITVVIPVYLLSTAINFMSYMSKDLSVSKMADTLKSLVTSILTAVFAVYSLTITLSGISAGSYDSIGFKAAKLAVGNTVPIIGSYVKDGLDMVVYAASMIKNAVGVAAVVLFFLSILRPLLSLAVFSLALKALAALSQPFADGKVSALLTDLSKTQSQITAGVVTVSFMYLLSMLVILVSSNMLL